MHRHAQDREMFQIPRDLVLGIGTTVSHHKVLVGDPRRSVVVYRHNVRKDVCIDRAE